MPRTALSALTAVLGLALLSPAALAKKKKKDKGADAPAAAGPDLSAMQVPDDKASREFAENLVRIEINDFRPSDGGGAKFEYTSLGFAPDNSWKAAGYIEIQDERMECTESGTWSMETAESTKTATISWTLAKTDCPGREAGGETRAEVTLGKSGFENIKFR
jgi:hypothetical protein